MFAGSENIILSAITIFETITVGKQQQLQTYTSVYVCKSNANAIRAPPTSQ